MRQPTIERFMSREPVCIERDATVGEAWRRMVETRARHLPVLHGARLVGVVSHRDLLRLETAVNIDRLRCPISDAMVTPVYSVAPTASLHEVVRHMAGLKLGSAVVVDEGRVVGIFTTTDALRALAGLLAAQADAAAGGGLA
jgi:acetoin utilization protein AcuB